MLQKCCNIWQATDKQCLTHCPSCPQTKLESGLQWLHSADYVAVKWLTQYDAWMHATTTTTRLQTLTVARCCLLVRQFDCMPRFQIHAVIWWISLCLCPTSPLVLPVIEPIIGKCCIIHHKNGSIQRTAMPPEKDWSRATGSMRKNSEDSTCSSIDICVDRHRETNHNTLLLLFSPTGVE